MSLKSNKPLHIRNLWKHVNLTTSKLGVSIEIPPHGAALYKIS
ncbi:MAG: hypothetical protein K6T85_18960 [Gorillibacterium sp.]|nr:hypothetical protein [Gorillibacterium sp.]